MLRIACLHSSLLLIDLALINLLYSGSCFCSRAGECGSGKSSLANAVLQKLGCELADVQHAMARKTVEETLLRRKYGGDDTKYVHGHGHEHEHVQYM